MHHRSEIDPYAGLRGWDVPQMYGRTKEQIDEIQAQRLNEQQLGLQ